jgi:nucleoid DNA-binding protein
MAPRTTKPAGKPATEKPAKPAAKIKPVAEAAQKPARSATKPAAKPTKPAGGAKVRAGSNTEAFRLKDLVEAVATATGGKRPEVKKTVEATLSSLAEALKRGSDLNLPPLGRIRVAKAAGKDGAPAMTLKLRLAGADKPGGKLALAEDGEDS